jgi:NTE family protein
MSAPRVGLVLGAGGPVGHAYHSGVLTAIEEATGWDPRDAEIVVGTSAGSVVGASLRAGASVSDLYAGAVGDTLSSEGARLLRAFRTVVPEPPDDVSRVRRGMAAPALLARAALRPLSTRVGSLAAAALPPGRIPVQPVAAGFAALFPEGWPDRPLWICAVRLDRGRRVVFGRQDAPSAAVADAVAASCAIPAYYRPVDIGGVRYVDGGVHSPTNADVLAGLGLDLVIVSSPMSAARGSFRPAFDLTPRAAWHLRLSQEARKIRRAGTPVVALEPGASVRRVMGLNGLDRRRRGPVAAQARDSALRWIARSGLLEVLRVRTA